MFEDSLVESSGRLSARRPWATAASFAVQSAVIVSLLLLSLVYTESLPIRRWIITPEAPPPPPSAPVMRSVVSSAPSTASASNVLTVPREIPPNIPQIRDELPTNPIPPGTMGVVLNSVPDDSFGTVTKLLRNAPPASPKLAASKVRVSSGVAQGLLIPQVNPQYPPPARLARIEGKVVLQALIGKDGTIQNLHVISGHPMLTEAAMDAVRQWVYKPYYLNGEPVEVETMINVNFTLAPQ
jgi:periplasmic protein TonB